MPNEFTDEDTPVESMPLQCSWCEHPIGAHDPKLMVPLEKLLLCIDCAAIFVERKV